MAKRVNKRFLVVLTTIVLVGGVTGMAAIKLLPKLLKKNPQALVAEAQQLEKEGNIGEAISRYRQACNADPANPELRVALGDLCNRHVTIDPDNIGKARQAWQDALTVDPAYKPAMQRLLDMNWGYMNAAPRAETFAAVREAAARLLDLDKADRKAATRLNVVPIRMAQTNVPNKPGEIDKAIKALKDLAHQDPTDADPPYWAVQGEIHQALQAAKRVSDREEARDMVAKIEPEIDAMVKGQDNNAVMQFRAAQLYAMLGPVEYVVNSGKPTTAPAKAGAATATATTRPTTAPAVTRMTLKQVAGRFVDRINAALDAARRNAKPGDEHFVEINLTAAEWARSDERMEDAKKIIDELVKVQPNDPLVRTAFSRAFKDDPARRPQVIELLGKPLSLDGLTGVEALQRKDQQIGLQIELANVRLKNVEAERDPAKRKQMLEKVLADAKQLEGATGPQSVPMMELKGKLKLIQGKVPEAILLLQQSVDRRGEENPNYEVMYALAGAYLQMDQTGNAEKLLHTIVARVPAYTPAGVMRVQALLMENRTAEAREQVAALKKIAPNLKELPAMEAAVEGGDKRSAFVKDLPENTAPERLRKSQLLRGEGKTEEAIAMAEASFKTDPKYLAAVEELVGLYMAGDRRDEAIAVVQKAIAANPDNQQLKVALDSLTKRTPAELDKWRLDQIAKENDGVQRELRYLEYYLQKSNTAAVRNDEPERAKQAAEAEKHLAAAEKLKPDDMQLLTKRFEFLLRTRRIDEASKLQQRLAAANVDEVNGQMLRFQLARAKSGVAKTPQEQAAAFAEAESAALNITRQRPQFALGWQYLGLATLAEGKYRDAVNAYTAAIERQGRNYEALRGLIEAYYKLNDTDEAKNVLDRAREMFPNDVPLRELALNHEMNYGDPRKVVAERERIYKENPDLPGNAMALADAYLRTLNDAAPDASKQTIAKARKVLEDGMKKWPDNVAFQVPLAQVMLAQDDFTGGEKILKAYAARNDVTDKAQANLTLADYYVRAGKPNMAEQALRDALKETKDPAPIKLQLAQLFAATGRPLDGVKELEGVAGPQAAMQRVALLRIANKTDEASKAVAEAVAANPHSPEVANLQVQLLVEANKFDEAQKLVSDRLAKNAGDEAAHYYNAMIKLARKPGDPAGAAKEMAGVAERNPRALDAQVLLADAYYAMGDTGSAIDTLDRAVQIASLRRDLRLKLIDWCAAAGRWDSVIKLASEAANNPRFANDFAWPRALAGAYSATGKPADAEKQIARAISLAPKEQAADLERQHLIILNAAKNYGRVVQLTNDWMAKGRKEWWIYVYRGLAKAGMKDKSALSDLDTALASIDPVKDYSTAKEIVNSVLQIGGLPEALKRTAKWEPNLPQWRILTGELCFDAGDTAAAVQHLLPLEKEVDKLPPDQQAAFRIALARSYHQLKPKPDLANAAEQYKKYLGLQPKDVLALNNLAYLLAEEISPPRLADAKVCSQKLYDITKDWKPSDSKARILDTHGWVLVLNGGKDLDEGIRVFEAVNDEFPILETRYHLGEAFLKKKQGDDALEQLTQAQGMIEKAKKNKTPFDESLEPRVQRALDSAKAFSAAAKAR
jgi:predicted Zn-dependent protease